MSAGKVGGQRLGQDHFPLVGKQPVAEVGELDDEQEVFQVPHGPWVPPVIRLLVNMWACFAATWGGCVLR